MISSSDRLYWAKGTGFGTGSTTSSWNIEATRVKKKLEEKYVTLCFAIIAEFLSTESEQEDKGHELTTPTEMDGTSELVDMLSGSCLLPGLASYLLNDSGK